MLSFILYTADLSTRLSENPSRSVSPAPSVSSESTEGSSKLDRWEDSDVRLLITTWSDHKHLFGGKATKKDIFERIAEAFTKESGRRVTGEQCLRKWGKLVSKQKEIEDHNNKSGNCKKSWKFYEELAQCLARDATVKPAYTMESSLHLEDREGKADCSSTSESDAGESRLESVIQPACTSESSDSCGKRTKNESPKKRYRKKPRSSSSASEMLEFLKQYSEQREKVEEEKLKLLKEMKEEKTAFFNRFFDYMEKK